MLCFFFFQAEDGIRDLVRSRGLGDVYKSQLLNIIKGEAVDSGQVALVTDDNQLFNSYQANIGTVSYTHLTLPTSDLV